jgi:hypothetical protein
LTKETDEKSETVYRTVLRFNAIYVIESLRPGDQKTGEELYDSIIFPRTRDLEGCYTQYLRVNDEGGLRAALRQIATRCQDANHLPFVHIEAHGGDDGIQLTGGDLVPWTALIGALTAINEACRMNLLVMAVACKGWSLTYSLMPSDRAPLFMLIGPPEDASPDALLNATRKFYGAFVEHLDLNEALEAMNDHQPFEQWTIKPATAEILFCRVFRMYVNEAGVGEKLQARENELVAAIARRRNLNVLQTARVRTEVRADLSDHRSAYERLRKTFLMLDIFPENEERFGLTYDRCFKGASRP